MFNPLSLLSSLLILLHLRRQSIYHAPTLLDSLLASPLQYFVTIIYHFVLKLRGRPFHPPKYKAPIRVVSLGLVSDEKGGGLILPDSDTSLESLPEGDLLILVLTDYWKEGRDEGKESADEKDAREEDTRKLVAWLRGRAASNFRWKIVVDGRRRQRLRANGDRKWPHGVEVLEDRLVTLEFKDGRRLNVYGRGNGRDPWRGKVPEETDVLVTHTAPKHHRDLGLGSNGLLEEIWQVKPRLHVFGGHSTNYGREAVYFDECQREYEALMVKRPRGILRDLIAISRWLDALRIVGYGVRSLLWKWIMEGPGSNNGGLMVGLPFYGGNKKRLKKAVVADL